MKKFIILSILGSLFYTSLAAQSSSFTVQSHDHVDMTWYGNYDQWAVFPPDTGTYRKIILHYDMGCATGGCSPWDYTTQIQLRHRTGNLDSTLQQQATFTVDGSVWDSVFFNMTTTYTTFYDTLAMATDSSANSTYTIVVYGDTMNPTTPTDTVYGYPANYWNYDFDSGGNIIDSNFVSADSLWHVDYMSYYNVFDEIITYELARVITPYGGNLGGGFSFIQDFDVTDFADLLQDSVEIRAHYSGWSSGFSATLDFEFFPGTPPRDVISVESVYRGGFGYSNSSNFETNYLYPKNFFIDPNTQGAKVRMTATGHGFDNNIYAAEFYPATYYLNIDSVQTHSQLNWNGLCGENPIYPDYESSSSYVHTWLYDRANWCPGLRADVHQFDITPYITPNDSVNINIDWENYSWTGSQTPSYIIDCQLVQYGAPNFTNDVELYEIVAPSEKDEFARINPLCSSPKVTIRNFGGATLTSCDIDYNVDGGPTETYHWTGSLAFMDTVTVDLPIANHATFWGNSTTNYEFFATVKNPNGVTDEYPDNNDMSSTYEMVPTYASDIIISFRTNLDGSESAYRLLDGSGNVVYSKSGMSNNTIYNDTVSLAEGCYVFEITDSGGDGLYFYYNSSGSGFCRFKYASTGFTFRNFDPDFGRKWTEEFKVGYLFDIEEPEQTGDVAFYPNPGSGLFNVDLAGFGPGEIMVQAFNAMGQQVYTREVYSPTGEEVVQVDLTGMADGVYIIRVLANGKPFSGRVIKTNQ